MAQPSDDEDGYHCESEHLGARHGTAEAGATSNSPTSPTLAQFLAASADAEWTIAMAAASLRMPWLLLQGDRDPFGMSAHIRIAAERKPRAGINLLTGVGHSSHQTEGRLPDMIRDFLALSRNLENRRESSWLALSASQRDSLGENRLPSHDMAGHQRLCLVFETQLDDFDDAVVLRH